jgi:hypothetical protein
MVRTPSPSRRHLHHDIGFSDTVSNVVDIVKEEHRRGRPYGHGNRYSRGSNHTYVIIVFSLNLMLCVLKFVVSI